MGRLASGPCLVGSLGSEARVNASFQIFALRMLRSFGTDYCRSTIINFRTVCR